MRADRLVSILLLLEVHRTMTARELALIEGADHVFMRHEWERELIERSVAWLVRTL
jgi:hypothetical protein